MSKGIVKRISIDLLGLDLATLRDEVLPELIREYGERACIYGVVDFCRGKTYDCGPLGIDLLVEDKDSD